MKELEDDAIRAQAVIVKAQELQDSKQAAGNIFDFEIRCFRLETGSLLDPDASWGSSGPKGFV